MQSRALLFLACFVQLLLDRDDVLLKPTHRWHDSIAGIALIQQSSSRGIGFIEAEDFALEAPTRTNAPSIGLLLVQAALLLALLGVVLLISHALKERNQQEPNEDHIYVQTYNGMHVRGGDGAKRFSVNDKFKTPSRSSIVGTPRSPPRDPQEGVPVALNRSLSAPANRRYPSYGSPNLNVHVPKLDLPVQTAQNTPSVPAGLHLENYPAWGNLGTHSSMTSEEGSFATTSHPSTFQHSPKPQPPLTTPRTGSLGPVSQPAYQVENSPLPTSSVPIQPGNPGFNGQLPLSPLTASPPPGSWLPIQHTPPVPPPDSQTLQEQPGAPVLLQWFPGQPAGSGASSWTPSQGQGQPMRTRSLSPVPSSHYSLNDIGGETPHFLGGVPSFAEISQASDLPTQPRGQQQATLRPAANFGLAKSASQAGFQGVEGIVQWFNLATPRPGFVPTGLAPLESPNRGSPSKPSPPPAGVS